MSYVFVEADASSSTPFDGPFRLQLCSTLSLDCPDYVVDRGHAYYVRCVRDFSAVVSTGERTPQKFYPASGSRYPNGGGLSWLYAFAYASHRAALFGAHSTLLYPQAIPTTFIAGNSVAWSIPVRCVRDLIGRRERQRANDVKLGLYW